MKKFSFRLESVLKVRETRKKLAEKAVSATQTRLNKVVDEVQSIDHKRQQSFYFERPGDEMTFWMGVCDSFRKRLNIEKDQLEAQRQKLEQQLQVEKKKLLVKLREEKVMTTLKESQFQDYLREVDKAEQQEMEELDILKRGNKK